MFKKKNQKIHFLGIAYWSWQSSVSPLPLF